MAPRAWYEYPVPNEVAGCAVRALIALADNAGLGLLSGEDSLTANELSSRRRFDWEVYAHLLDRFVERAGGLDEAARLAEDLHLGGGALDWVLSSRFASRHLYAQACALAPRAWRNLDVTITPLGDALRIRAQLREGTGSTAFFLISRSSIANLPARAGLCRADVGIEDLSATGATWLVSPPPNPNAAPELPFEAVERIALETRVLGRRLSASTDSAALQANLQAALAELGAPGPVRVLAGPEHGAIPVSVRGGPLAWIAVEPAAREAVGPLLPWIARGFEHLRALESSPHSPLAGLALQARVGASFVVDGVGQVAWANGPGWAWLASTRDGRGRLRVAALRRASSAEFVVRGMTEPAGHVVVTLSDPEGDARDRATAAGDAWRLTPTEMLVLAEVLRGASNKEVGAELGMAEATVETHMTHVFRKAGVHGRTALVSRVWSTAW